MSLASLAAALLFARGGGPAAARYAEATPSPTLAPEAQTELDKCETLRSQVESIIGTIAGAPVHARGPQQDMPALTCLYRSTNGWLTVSYFMSRDRGEFERMAAAVQGSARIDGLTEVAFGIPLTPQQRPTGATIVAYQGGTQFTLEVASGTKTADELATDLKGLARTIASDDRLLHGIDRQPGETQHLQGGG